jgi:hypothetical protein
MQSTMHVYEVRPRKDYRGVDLISDVLPFGRLWYTDDALPLSQHVQRLIRSDHATCTTPLRCLIAFKSAKHTRILRCVSETVLTHGNDAHVRNPAPQGGVPTL